jgi:HAD superfamily hydrolase (TIGR01459 family)
MAELISFLPGIGSLVHSYDGFIIDQWGVLHDGVKPYDGVIECLTALRERSVPVAILTNSSKSEVMNRDRLDGLGIPASLYGPLVSTADLLKDSIVKASQSHCPRLYLLASDTDATLFEGEDVKIVDNLDEAECVVLLSLDDETAEFPARAPWIEDAVRRGIPLHTPSADSRSVISGGRISFGFGRVVEYYRTIGGAVCLHGKPNALCYSVSCLRMGLGKGSRIAAVGDQFDTDIIGAVRNSLDPILVETGAATQDRNGKSFCEWANDLNSRCRQIGVRSMNVLPSLRW